MRDGSKISRRHIRLKQTVNGMEVISMKAIFLRFLALGLICALALSFSAHGVTPQQMPMPTENPTWWNSVKTTTSRAIGQYVSMRVSNCAFYYALPGFLSKFLIIPQDRIPACIATTAALTLITSRYQREVHNLCGGDQSVLNNSILIASLLTAFMPKETSLTTGLAVIAGLQAKEWAEKRKMRT